MLPRYGHAADIFAIRYYAFRLITPLLL